MRKRRDSSWSGGFTTIMLDVMFNLVMCFMVIAHATSRKLTSVRAVASTVPDLKLEINGLDRENGLLTNKVTSQEITIGRLNTENGGLELAVGKLNEKIGEYESRFQSGKPVTVVFLVDTTLSMRETISRLGVGMETTCEIMPNRSKDFRVGIIGFRRGVDARFEITRILPRHEDNVASQRSVLSFIKGLKTENGWTEHKSVFLAAVRAISKAHPTADPEREIILCVLGDVGPSELDEKQGYTSPEERVAKREILAGLKKWVRMGNHSVMALYAESKSTEADPSGAENKKWFQDLGSVSPKSGFYTDTTALLQAIHHATER